MTLLLLAIAGTLTYVLLSFFYPSIGFDEKRIVPMLQTTWAMLIFLVGFMFVFSFFIHVVYAWYGFSFLFTMGFIMLMEKKTKENPSKTESEYHWRMIFCSLSIFLFFLIHLLITHIF